MTGATRGADRVTAADLAYLSGRLYLRDCAAHPGLASAVCACGQRATRWFPRLDPLNDPGGAVYDPAKAPLDGYRCGQCYRGALRRAEAEAIAEWDQ